MKGIFLGVGLNKVGPFYQDGAPLLHGCINDVAASHDLATAGGLTGLSLYDQAATREAVLSNIRDAASILKTGDLFLLHYSGHGCQGDLDGEDYDASGHFNSCWCTYDTVLLNHDIHREWSRFAPGVRIVVISDSCHSEHATREFIFGAPVYRDRALPIELQRELRRAHPEAFRKSTDPTIDPTCGVLLLAGCQDLQTSRDGDRNGLFTEGLLDSLAGATSWNHLFTTAQARTMKMSRGDQCPVLFPVGDAVTVASLMQDAPFTL